MASVGPAQAREGSWMEWGQEGKGEEWQACCGAAQSQWGDRDLFKDDRSSLVGRGGSKMQERDTTCWVLPWT